MPRSSTYPITRSRDPKPVNGPSSIAINETSLKEYDVIAIGTGSAVYVVDGMMQRNPNINVAVINKDEPGGICLQRSCIP